MTIDRTLFERSRAIEFTLAEQNQRWARDSRTADAHARFRAERFGDAGVVLGPPGAVLNAAVGVGLSGTPPEDEIDAVLTWADRHGGAPEFEVSPFAHPGTARALLARGWGPDHTLQVFWREPGASAIEQALAEAVERGGLAVRWLDKSDVDACEAAARVIARGFDWRDPEGNGLDAARLTALCQQTHTALLFDGDTCVGGGSCGVSGTGGRSVCQIFGASVLPEARRREGHRALLAARVLRGESLGATAASLDCKTGLVTERGAQRLGFALAYTKAVWAKRRLEDG